MKRTVEANFLPAIVGAIQQMPRILIVDNNRDFTHSVKLALERTGRYFVCEENDAAKAHQTARDLRPDLILLDIAMPEVDGGEVAARIQSDLRIQGHPFLAKPITLPELIEGIEENLPACAAF